MLYDAAAIIEFFKGASDHIILRVFRKLNHTLKFCEFSQSFDGIFPPLCPGP
jgi:hypothetical protein